MIHVVFLLEGSCGVCVVRKNEHGKPLGGCYELKIESFLKGRDHVFVFQASSPLVPGTYLACRLALKKIKFSENELRVIEQEYHFYTCSPVPRYYRGFENPSTRLLLA